MVGLDVLITVACAIISTAMAVLQYGAARKALKVAWQIAADQAEQSERTRQTARREFVEAVSSLAAEALIEAEKAVFALSNGSGSDFVLYNFTQRLADLHEALQPIRGAAPPDAKLILAVGKFSRALKVRAPTGNVRDEALQMVKQHQGSIGIELGNIRAFEVAHD